MSSSSDLSAILAALPACGLDCLIQGITTASNCSLTDTTCSCASSAVQSTASLCVAANCTIPEALATQNGTNTLCGVQPNEKASPLPVVIVFCAITVLAIFARFVARLRTRAPLGWDDWTALLSTVFLVAWTVNSGYMVHLGVGLPIWAVEQDSISKILIFFWVNLMLYMLSRVFVRISISIFLLRIFHVSNAKHWIIGNAILNILLTAGTFPTIIFNCTPVSYFWTAWDGMHSGWCVQKWDLLLSVGVLAIVFDVVHAVMPLPWVWQLQFPLTKKLVTGAMFSLGALIVIFSALRVQSLHVMLTEDDVTTNLSDVILWAGLELCMAIILACVPSLRIVFMPLFDTVKKWTSRGSSSPGGTGPSKFHSDNSGKRMVTIGGSDMPSYSTRTQIMKHSKVSQTVSETYLQLDDIDPYGHQGQVRAQAWR